MSRLGTRCRSGPVTRSVAGGRNEISESNQAMGRPVNNRYATGNLLRINCPVSPSVTNSYDGLNCVTNMLDGVRRSHYTYTAVSQLLSGDGLWSDDTFGCACKFMQRV